MGGEKVNIDNVPSFDRFGYTINMPTSMIVKFSGLIGKCTIYTKIKTKTRVFMITLVHFEDEDKEQDEISERYRKTDSNKDTNYQLDMFIEFSDEVEKNLEDFQNIQVGLNKDIIARSVTNAFGDVN